MHSETGKRVAVLYGGESVEHRVSCRSAATVCTKLKECGCIPIPIALSRKGRWSLHRLPQNGADMYELDSQFIPEQEVVIRLGQGLVLASTMDPLEIDIAFPLIHGYGGEDGKLQGLLELAHIPYIGCGCSASANGMHKFTMKLLAKEIGVPVLPGMVVERRKLQSLSGSDDPYIGQLVEEIAERIGNRVLVKPEDGGSSVGITVVRILHPRSLYEALKHTARFSRYILVEPWLEQMQELEVAVVTDGSAISASDPGQLIDPMKSSLHIVTYEQKYLADQCAYMQVPAKIPEEAARTVSHYAISVAKVLGVEGYARVDFFYDAATSEIHFNEINTIPGMTATSHFPVLAKSMDYDWSTLLPLLVREGLDSYSRKTDRELIAVE